MMSVAHVNSVWRSLEVYGCVLMQVSKIELRYHATKMHTVADEFRKKLGNLKNKS